MTIEMWVDTAARAIVQRMGYEQQIRDANASRDEAYAALVRDCGLTSVEAAAKVRDALVEAGLTTDELDGAGVSHDRVWHAARAR